MSSPAAPAAPPGPAGTTAPSAPATPTGRLLSAMFVSNVGAYVGLLTPLQLLMTIHLTRIAGSGAESAFGLITGVGALFALVANPFGGRISDRTAVRFGRRRTWILTGGIGGALAVFGLGVTTEVWQMAIVWCVTQTLFNFQLAATSALMADQVPTGRRGSASGMLGLAAAFGPLAGLAAVSAIASPLAQWAVAAVTAAVLGIVAVLLLRDPRHDTAGEGRLGILGIARSLWFDPRKHPALGWAWLIRFCITCAAAIATYNAFFLIDRFGMSTTEVGTTVFSLSLTTVALLALTSVAVGPLSDRLQRQKPFAMAAGVLGAGALVLMALANEMWIVFVAVALLGIAQGLLVSVDTALCVRMLPNSDNAGKDLGVINMANTLPQSVVPFIAPGLLALGGYPMLYVVLAVVALAGAAAVVRLPEIGHEGDPRWAPITRPTPIPTDRTGRSTTA